MRHRATTAVASPRPVRLCRSFAHRAAARSWAPLRACARSAPLRTTAPSGTRRHASITSATRVDARAGPRRAPLPAEVPPAAAAAARVRRREGPRQAFLSAANGRRTLHRVLHRRWSILRCNTRSPMAQHTLPRSLTLSSTPGPPRQRRSRGRPRRRRPKGSMRPTR